MRIRGIKGRFEGRERDLFLHFEILRKRKGNQREKKEKEKERNQEFKPKPTPF